jgi:hypothetical protein
MTQIQSSSSPQDLPFASAHGQLLSGLRARIHTHPQLSSLWGEWPGSTGLSLGSLESTPWSSASFAGERHLLELRLQTRPDSTGDGAHRIETIIAHLDNAELPLDGHALIDFRFCTARSTGCITESLDCRICFEALTLADPPWPT